jgi:hypothetical protein
MTLAAKDAKTGPSDYLKFKLTDVLVSASDARNLQ